MDDVLTGPLSRKITNEDRQGIEALFNAADDAWGQRDLQALTTLYDFPIYVGTDDSGGTYQGAEWDADQFRAAMTAALQADGNRVDRRQKRTPHFLSDSMAIILVETSVRVSATELGSYPSAILVIKMGTRWCFKGGVEAGHGRRAECPV